CTGRGRAALGLDGRVAPSLGPSRLRRASVFRPRRTLHPHARSALGLARSSPRAACCRVPAGGGRLVSSAGVVPAAGASAARDRQMPRAFRALWSPLWIAFVACQGWVGIGAVRGDAAGPGSGFRASFGGVGLLCVARLVATAAIQRRGTGRGLAAPLRLTLATWLLGRLANWWLVDLARGMSPLP